MRYDAAAFLDSLFRSPPGEGPAQVPGMGPDDLPGDWRVEWEERAAIMEFEGKLPRERAEALAMADIIKAMERQRTG